MNQEIESLTSKAKGFSTIIQTLHQEISTVIVGQDKIIEKITLSICPLYTPIFFGIIFL